MIKQVEFEKLVIEKIMVLTLNSTLNSGQVPVQNQQQAISTNALGRCSGVFIFDFKQRFPHVNW